jgi:hypothetical protein
VGRKKKKVRGKEDAAGLFFRLCHIPDCACLNQQSYLVKWYVIYFYFPVLDELDMYHYSILLFLMGILDLALV